MSEKKYIILKDNELSNVKFSEVIETAANTLRYNLASTEFIVKFMGDTPSFLDGKTQLTSSEIVALTKDATNGWIKD